MTHMDTHIYITSALLFFLHLFHSSWQAGWSRSFPSDTLIPVLQFLYSLTFLKGRYHTVLTFIQKLLNSQYFVSLKLILPQAAALVWIQITGLSISKALYFIGDNLLSAD